MTTAQLSTPHQRIPLVNYLELDPEPRLVASECVACGSRFLDRRSACAACFGTDFRRAPLATEGTVCAFTIVHQAAPGIDVPYVAATVDCGGTLVAGNILGASPDPDVIRSGMAVRLMTYSLGADGDGTEAIAFAFEPAT